MSLAVPKQPLQPRALVAIPKSFRYLGFVLYRVIWMGKNELGRSCHKVRSVELDGGFREQISVVPSLIHYAADGRRWVGDQVFQRNLHKSRRTFRWMKRYIANRSPIRVQLDNQAISHLDAGRDFLSSVLLFAAEEINFGSLFK